LSLIEFLMTVAILAILAARLLPFSGAKPRALQVTDPSNERQSPLGLAMYGAKERGA
jgi:Tfp pilus assembly protein FimT